MSWGKLDDKFHRHTKIRTLRKLKGGNAAIGVWTFWWSWCLDDPSMTGIVPYDEVEGAKDMKSAQLLLDVGLWERRDTGFLFHDFHVYNPTAEQKEAQRKAHAEAQRRHRANKVVTNHGDELVTNHPSGEVISQSSRVRTRAPDGTGRVGDLSPEPDRVEKPHLPPEPDGSDPGHWLRAFTAAWMAHKNAFGYGQGSDAKACSSLDVTLGAMSPSEVAKAWGARNAMFAAFFALADAKTVAAQHIFAFFVPRFTALAMQATKAPRKSEYQRLTPETMD